MKIVPRMPGLVHTSKQCYSVPAVFTRLWSCNSSVHMLAHSLPRDICSAVPGWLGVWILNLFWYVESRVSSKSQKTRRIGQSARSVAALHHTQSSYISRHIHCGGEGRQALVGSATGRGLRSSGSIMIIWDSMRHNDEKLLNKYTVLADLIS